MKAVMMNSLMLTSFFMCAILGSQRDESALIKTNIGWRLCELFCKQISQCVSFNLSHYDLKCRLNLDHKHYKPNVSNNNDKPCSWNRKCTRLLISKKKEYRCVALFARKKKQRSIDQMSRRKGKTHSFLIAPFLSNHSECFRYSIQDGEIYSYANIDESLVGIVSMHFVKKSRSILFSEKRGERIRTLKLFSMTPLEVIVKGKYGRRMAVDGDLLFFSDGVRGILHRAFATKLNIQSDIKVIYLAKSKDIDFDIDTQRKRIYLLEKQFSNSYIKSINYDGRERKTIYKGRFIVKPIAYDYDHSIIYYYQRGKVRNFNVLRTKKGSSFYFKDVVEQMVYHQNMVYLSSYKDNVFNIHTHMFNLSGHIRTVQHLDLKRKLYGQKLICFFK